MTTPCMTVAAERKGRRVSGEQPTERLLRDGKLEQQRRYRETHRAEVRERGRLYREANRDACAARSKDWARRHPDRVREHLRANKANQTAKRHGVPQKLTADDIRAVDAAGACAHCGSPDRRSIDHIIPLSKGGPNTRANLQRLCLPCNHRKHTGESVPQATGSGGTTPVKQGPDAAVRVSGPLTLGMTP